MRVYFHKIWWMIWFVLNCENIKLQDIIKKDDLNYKSKPGKT